MDTTPPADPPPDEIAEAHDQLTAAVTNLARVKGYLDAGEIISVWALVAETQQLDADNDVKSGYLTLHTNGHQPSHAVMGLYTVGLTMAQDAFKSDPTDGSD